jgi:hypothetical protein
LLSAQPDTQTSDGFEAEASERFKIFAAFVADEREFGELFGGLIDQAAADYACWNAK